MAKKSAEKLTKVSLAAAAEKPTYVTAEGHEGPTPPGYRTCKACNSWVKGPKTLICLNPKCENPFPKPEKHDGDKSPRTKNASGHRNNGVLTFKDFENAQQLVADLGGGDPDKAKEVIKAIQQIGSVEDANRAISAWGKLLASAGSVDAAEKMLKTLNEMGALAK